MSRPKNAVPSKEKRIAFPINVADLLDDMLYDELLQRVPHGAYGKYLSLLVEQDYKRSLSAGATKAAVLRDDEFRGKTAALGYTADLLNYLRGTGNQYDAQLAAMLKDRIFTALESL